MSNVDIRQKIGQKIAQARKGRGWTQDELAAHLGKTRQTISIYERGSKTIPILELESLAHLLGIPIQYFFSDSASDYELQQIIGSLKPTYRDLALYQLKQVLERQNNPPTHKINLDAMKNTSMETEIDDEALIHAYLETQKSGGTDKG